MKCIILTLLVFSTGLLFAQTNDKLEYFRFSGDTVLFYLNEVGDITVKPKAEFFRKTRFAKTGFNYDGKVEDYTINNKISYTCFYSNGDLNGEAINYYKNGQIKYAGHFKNSLRDSTWLFYYPNGNKEKVVVYNADTFFIKEFYNNTPLIFKQQFYPIPTVL